MRPPATSLWETIRHWLAKHVVFRDEYRKIEIQRETFEKLRRDLAEKHKQFDEWVAKWTIADAVRFQLKGFNPKLLDNDDDLPSVFDDVENENEFLAGCNTLAKDKNLMTLAAYLTRNQLLYTSKEAINFDHVNFGRASVNGISLLREELERMAAIYRERHPGKDTDFDEHEVV